MEEALRAIPEQNAMEMQMRVNVYRNPNTRFDVETWNGPCTLPPLALAVEASGLKFENVLRVLVEGAGIDPSDPYEIEDHAQGVRIRTNALTHMLARWDFWKPLPCRHRVLSALLAHGADATVPALYEVTPIGPPAAWVRPGAKQQPPPRTHQLAAVAQQRLSLIAFVLVQEMPVNVPFDIIITLIQLGHAHFIGEDPTGLFVKSVRMRGENATHWLEQIMQFLCPAGGAAHGELRRIVQGMDPDSGMNILHLYVALGSAYRLMPTVQRILMLRDIYGLDLCLPTADGRTLTALAAASTNVWAQRMQQAVAEALEDEFLKRHRALALVQGLPSLPRETLYRLGR